MHADAPLYSPVNHVFVDFENVRKVDLSVLGRKNFVVQLFIGPQNKTLNVEIVEKLLEHSHAVKLIRSPKIGNNALDFVLAFHLGQTVLTEPKAYFHIISGDEGFDSLVELLKSRNLKAKRHADWESLEATMAAKAISAQAAAAPVAAKAAAPTPKADGPPAVAKPAASPTPSPVPPKVALPSSEENLSVGARKLLENLRKSPKARPKKRATLVSHASSSLGPTATNAQGEALVSELLKAGKLKIDAKGAVAYKV